MHALETIYEVDEDLIRDDENDSSKSIDKPPRLSYYICICLIAGCFLIVGIFIVISLNPSQLSHKSRNFPLSLKDKIKLANKVNDHLESFSKEINEELDFQTNRLRFLTSTVSNSSFDTQNHNSLLWIYGDLIYPKSCIDNIQCKEKLQSKLQISFTKLSNVLTSIELSGLTEKEIQLNWCELFDNSTMMTLVWLVSINIKSEYTTEQSVTSGPNICGNIDKPIVLSEPADAIKENGDSMTTMPLSVIIDNLKLTRHPDAKKTISSTTDDEESSTNHNSPTYCSNTSDDINHGYETSLQCHGDIISNYLTI